MLPKDIHFYLNTKTQLEKELNNSEFLNKCKIEVIEKKRNYLFEIEEKLSKINFDFYNELIKDFNENNLIKIQFNLYLVEYERELKLEKKYRKHPDKIYSEEWFNFVYNPIIKIEEFLEIEKNLEKYLDERSFNQKMIDELIEKIYVSSKGMIEIQMKCSDVFQKITEILE